MINRPKHTAPGQKVIIRFNVFRKYSFKLRKVSAFPKDTKKIVSLFFKGNKIIVCLYQVYRFTDLQHTKASEDDLEE